MHKIFAIAAFGVMAAGSVMAENTGTMPDSMESQKREIEMQQDAAMSGQLPAHKPQTEVNQQGGRDVVGMPLDDGKTAGTSPVGNDHIIDMHDNQPNGLDNPMAAGEKDETVQ